MSSLTALSKEKTQKNEISNENERMGLDYIRYMQAKKSNRSKTNIKK